MLKRRMRVASLILFLIFDALLCGSWVSAADTIRAAPGDWPMYGHDLHHSFANPGSMINRSNAKSLVHAWTFVPGDAVSASPSVVNGKVYVGSWDGFFYALDAGSGAVRWKFPVDCDNAVVPVPPRCLAPGQPPPDRYASDGGLITSSAAVFHRVVYFASGKTVYALRAADGRLLWKRVLCGKPEESDCEADLSDPTRIFSSPTIFNGKMLLGLTVNGTGYRGAILALRLEDGATAWRFEVDSVLDSKGTVVGGNNRGCENVWASGAVDDITMWL
jgi:outer membrane protein assembly factor BamB